MPSEPPDADPHVRWCGGRRGEPGAYPIPHADPSLREHRRGGCTDVVATCRKPERDV